MKWFRRLVAFAAAVIATSVLGAIVHSQFVATEVSRLGQVGPAGLRSMIGSVVRRLPQVSPGRNMMLDWSRTRQARYTARMTLPLLRSEGGSARGDVASLLPARDGLLDDSFAHADGHDFLTQMMLVDTPGIFTPMGVR